MKNRNTGWIPCSTIPPLNTHRGDDLDDANGDRESGNILILIRDTRPNSRCSCGHQTKKRVTLRIAFGNYIRYSGACSGHWVVADGALSNTDKNTPLYWTPIPSIPKDLRSEFGQ